MSYESKTDPRRYLAAHGLSFSYRFGHADALTPRLCNRCQIRDAKPETTWCGQCVSEFLRARQC